MCPPPMDTRRPEVVVRAAVPRVEWQRQRTCCGPDHIFIISVACFLLLMLAYLIVAIILFFSLPSPMVASVHRSPEKMELPFDYMTFSDTQPLDLALTEYQLTNEDRGMLTQINQTEPLVVAMINMNELPFKEAENSITSPSKPSIESATLIRPMTVPSFSPPVADKEAEGEMNVQTVTDSSLIATPATARRTLTTSAVTADSHGDNTISEQVTPLVAYGPVALEKLDGRGSTKASTAGMTAQTGSQKEKSPAREMNPKSGATAPALFWIYGMPIGNVDVTPTKSSLPVTEQVPPAKDISKSNGSPQASEVPVNRFRMLSQALERKVKVTAYQIFLAAKPTSAAARPTHQELVPPTQTSSSQRKEPRVKTPCRSRPATTTPAPVSARRCQKTFTPAVPALPTKASLPVSLLENPWGYATAAKAPIVTGIPPWRLEFPLKL